MLVHTFPTFSIKKFISAVPKALFLFSFPGNESIYNCKPKSLIIYSKIINWINFGNTDFS